MKLAIIGSRSLSGLDLGKYISEEVTELVSGGAIGIDTCVATYATEHGIPLTVFFPNYQRYGRAAPIVRNKEIVDYADRIIAFWNGTSKGTLSVIAYSKKVNKPCEVILYP